MTGSIKFDIRVPELAKHKGAELKQQWGTTRRVLILASSHEGEDSLILDLDVL